MNRFAKLGNKVMDGCIVLALKIGKLFNLYVMGVTQVREKCVQTTLRETDEHFSQHLKFNELPQIPFW